MAGLESEGLASPPGEFEPAAGDEAGDSPAGAGFSAGAAGVAAGACGCAGVGDVAGVSDGFWLALVESMRGSSHATATSARMAVAAPSPIHNPRRGLVGAGGGHGPDGTGVNGGGDASPGDWAG